MVVLSLFDGISTGRVALERAGIPVSTYYASEVDKYALAVAKKNYPDNVQLGDVENYEHWDLDFGSIDLLIGGSPCQGFSYAGKQLNFQDERSKLFFRFVEILNKIRQKNPNVLFLLENVKMKKEYQDKISEYLGVTPIEINSSLVSAQHRKRLYWTNIEGITQPEDRGILLRDIVHEKTEFGFAMSDGWCRWFKKNAGKLLQKKYVAISPEKAITMMARQYANWQGNFIYEEWRRSIVPFRETLRISKRKSKRGRIGYFKVDSQGTRVYTSSGKSVTLCASTGGGGVATGLYYFGEMTPLKRDEVKPFSDEQTFYALTEEGEDGVLLEGYIRKLTPIECERLQTLPDHYTKARLNGKEISHSQRYKMLGNGWTAEVVAHVLRFIPEDRRHGK